MDPSAGLVIASQRSRVPAETLSPSVAERAAVSLICRPGAGSPPWGSPRTIAPTVAAFSTSRTPAQGVSALAGNGGCQGFFPGGGQYPFFSPDASWLGFVHEGNLKKGRRCRSARKKKRMGASCDGPRRGDGAQGSIPNAGVGEDGGSISPDTFLYAVLLPEAPRSIARPASNDLSRSSFVSPAELLF